MTNKIKKFLYILEHLIPDGYDEIPTFALYHPMLFTTVKVGIVKSNKLVCGGSLLSAYHVLTERSCARPERTSSADYLVLVGEHGTTDSVPRLYAVSHTKKYSHTLAIGNSGYGLWILILAERVTFSSVVAPICLPTSTSRLSLFEGEEVTVTGWARYSKPTHLEVNNTVVYIQASRDNSNLVSSGPPLIEIKKNVLPRRECDHPLATRKECDPTLTSK